MQNLMNDLTKLFQKDDRIFADSKLLKNKLTELALKLDQPLVELLLSDKRARKNFFIDQTIKKDTILVFDKDKFISFVNNKEFLPDSFTSFKNKIGLMTNGDYLKEKNDVVLAWAYKDCVLEGGQDREDQKQNEIFYNETLAPDEIDRLFEPKVLTNFKKYDSTGGHKITGFNADDNLIIKGNNLLALYSLKQKLRGQVKLIYIDPPYYYKEKKEGDTFAYNSDFKLSTWLTFMKNRLEVAKELLKKDGFILVQINDDGQAYLKVLMDKIFDDNFITSICVQMSYVSGEKMAHIDKKPPKIKEFLLFYSRNETVKINPQYTEVTLDKEYNKFVKKNNFKDPLKWEVVPLQDIFKEKTIKDDHKKEDFMLKNADLIFNRVRNKSKVFKDTLGNKKLTQIKTATGLIKWAWNGREAVFLSDRVIKNHEDELTYQQALGDIWTDIPIVNLYLEGNVQLLGGKKPEFLLKRIIDMTTQENDIVLDYHLGSGTTCAVAHKMGRKYIGIEQLDYGTNDAVIRLKNVINGDQTGISKDLNWKGDGSFIYAELMEWNEKYIQDIKDADTSRKLLNMYEKMKKESFFRYDIDLSKFDEKEFEKLLLKEQKQVLCECLDKNHLYVNLNEIDDATYKVSTDDKKLNKAFYKTVM